MATFDFLENFFFISLAITFGLILMLVYHFKSRIVAVEQKMDLMNEALTGVLKTCRSLIEQTGGGLAHLGKPQPVYQKQTVDLYVPPPARAEDHIMYQLREVSDEDRASEYEGESEDTFSDEEGEVEEHADTDVDADADADTDAVTVNEDQMDSVSEHDEQSEYDETDDDVMDEVDVYHVPPPSPKLDVSEPSSHNVMEEITTENENAEQLPEMKEVVDISPELDTTPVPTPDLGIIEEEPQQHNVVDDSVSEVSVFDKNAKEVYRKMSIGQLRTIAVSSGITVDTTKMKKNDLIKLLLQL